MTIILRADGRKYEGLWSNGKQSGKGKYVMVDNSVRWGLWKDGKRLRWLSPEEIVDTEVIQ